MLFPPLRQVNAILVNPDNMNKIVLYYMRGFGNSIRFQTYKFRLYLNTDKQISLRKKELM
jgi:hypothetical protein